MSQEKLAKSVIEEILGHPIKTSNYIGMKKNTQDINKRKKLEIIGDENKRNIPKTNITKFRDLPVEIELNILSFLGGNTQKNLLKYAKIDKTHLENFYYQTNNDYVIALKQSIIYDAEDIIKAWKFISKEKTKENAEKIIGFWRDIRMIYYRTSTVNYKLFEYIIKTKFEVDQRFKLNSPIIYLNLNDDKNEIAQMFIWNYVTEVKTLIMKNISFEFRPLNFKGFKYIENVQLMKILNS